jgi:nucleoside-diphosphate-sugar epimerase
MTIPTTIPRRVLLTGAAGFTGSHILKHLVEHTDCEVVAQVRTRDDRSLQRLRWATGDHWTRVTTWEWDLTWRHSGALADLGPAAGDRAKADALIDFDADAEPPRPGHQHPAGLSGGMLALYGWQAPETLVQDLAATVQWFLANPGWLA